MRRRRVRRCRSCGAILNGTRLMICESCQAAGMGREIRAEIDAEELLEVAIQREKMELAILEEMGLGEIAALARLYRAPYCTYGRFRAYVESTGRLPPEEARRK